MQLCSPPPPSHDLCPPPPPGARHGDAVNPGDQECTFAPTILDRSRKMLAQADLPQDFTERQQFLADVAAEKRAVHKQLLEEHECTFQPELRSSQSGRWRYAGQAGGQARDGSMCAFGGAHVQCMHVMVDTSSTSLPACLTYLTLCGLCPAPARPEWRPPTHLHPPPSAPCCAMRSQSLGGGAPEPCLSSSLQLDRTHKLAYQDPQKSEALRDAMKDHYYAQFTFAPEINDRSRRIGRVGGGAWAVWGWSLDPRVAACVC